MKTRRLAFRVTMNSALMILGVYAVMQIVTYFRDNVLLGLSGLSGLLATTLGFLAANVVPPLLVFSVLVYFLALRIQRVQIRLEAGRRWRLQSSRRRGSACSASRR